MTITVNVTAEHIRKGVAGECNLCPIALALQDAHGDRGMWGVGNANIWVNRPEEGEYWARPIYPMPQPVRKFIARFDGEKPVEPFAFTLEV